MIIIKIITLYFIQISNTDDFPSTGIPASILNLEKYRPGPRDHQSHTSSHLLTFPSFPAWVGLTF